MWSLFFSSIILCCPHLPLLNLLAEQFFPLAKFFNPSHATEILLLLMPSFPNKTFYSFFFARRQKILFFGKFFVVFLFFFFIALLPP
jgi:hypothetical protein